MEHEKPYSVYVKTDERGVLIDIDSDAFLTSFDGWEKIDEGYGDKYHHAQGNYLEKPKTDENGVYRYERKNGKIKERKKKDMEADVQERPKQPTDRERIEELANAVKELVQTINAIRKVVGI